MCMKDCVRDKVVCDKAVCVSEMCVKRLCAKELCVTKPRAIKLHVRKMCVKDCV